MHYKSGLQVFASTHAARLLGQGCDTCRAGAATPASQLRLVRAPQWRPAPQPPQQQLFNFFASACTCVVIPSAQSHSIPSSMPADDGTACTVKEILIPLDLVGALLVETFEVPAHCLAS